MPSTESSATGSFVTNESLTIYGLKASDKEKVIQQLADLLYAGGYVKDTYLSNVLSREAVMPTGLQTKAGGVAIPHTDSEHVNQSAIAIGLLETPVNFKNMAAPTEDVEVKLVFLLAIAEKNSVMTVLSRMAEMFLDPEILGHIYSLTNSKDIADYISIVFGQQTTLC